LEAVTTSNVTLLRRSWVVAACVGLGFVWDLILTFTSSNEEGGIIQLTGLPTNE
jgi:hypothetical protein